MGTVEPPLVNVKLTPPAPPTPAVRRARLDERLLPDAGGALTLVTGPTGAGKTALLANWFAHAGPARRGWVTFDGGDNDPVRFWSYVIAALQRIEPSIGVRGGEILAESRADRRLLATLLDDAGRMTEPGTLVVDDFQTIVAPALLDDVGWAVEHLPRQLHLVIASRSEPPFGLARLRLTGRLHEVRQSDLRFRPDEASTLLAGLEAHVDDEEVALLTARTEGWAAGLQLAGLSLRDHPDRAGFVRRFAGSTRVVADLLVDEVLDRQLPDVRTFLLQTSVLERFSAPLCDAVTGRRDSARVLRDLEEANLFLVPLDDERQWFRYHQLFADLLRSELRTSDPAGERAAHEAAGRWYEDEAHPSSAIRHHLAAGLLDRAWRVVVDYYAAYYLAGRHGTVQQWLASFPHEYLAADPLRSIEAGIASILAGELEKTGTWIGVARHALAARPDTGASAQLAAVEGIWAWHRGDVVVARQALEESRGALGDRWWPVLCDLDIELMVARAHLALGALDRAAEALQHLPPSRRHFDDVLVLSISAQVALARGSLRDAAADVTRAVALVESFDQPVGILMVDLRYVRGSLLVEQGRLVEGAVELATALAQAEQAGGVESIASISVALARALAGAGQTADARTTLRRAREVVGPRPNDHPMAAWLTGAECRLRIASGRLEAAGRLLESLPRGPERARLEVRLHLAAGRRGVARRLLAEITGGATTTRGALVDELLTALALAGDDDARAADHVASAVQLAEEEGFVQAFLDEAPELTALLRRLDAAGSSAALHRLVEAADGASGGPWVELRPLGAGRLVEPLSEREIGVLRYLPSPLPSRDIARELYISPNTLKTHMRNLYRKLEVGSRSEAVARARALELL